MQTLSLDKPTKLKPAPALMVFASLLIWGWQTDYLLFALGMGILLELPLFVSWRINFSEKDINQIVDLSGVLFFIAIIYVFANYAAQGIYKILELLPFALFLVLLTQRYNASNTIKTSALFISIRRLGKDADEDVLFDMDISLPYVFICLISASAGYKFNELYFALCSCVIIWLLWCIRPRQFLLYQWLIPVLLVFAIAFVTQIGIRRLQSSAEAMMLSLFDHYGWRSRDPERAMTAIGSLGRLKLSDRILIRIKSEQPVPLPLYLRETTYNQYEYSIWRNPETDFDFVKKSPGKKEWRINRQLPDTEKMEFGLYLEDQYAIIPVPQYMNSLTGQDLVQVETNIYGAVRIDAREGWINYRLGSAVGQKLAQAVPEKEDLEISPKHKADFERLATELKLYNKSPTEIIQTVKKHFAENYYYSLSQNQRFTKGGYLAKFLFEHKQGHCEYFATATALLLREAGIPSRYTIGYSVSEYSTWQQSYLVRARDAHSWVQYYHNDEWHILDTTPANWAPLEAEDKALLEPFMDIFSWLRYQLTSESIEGDAENNNLLVWLLIPLLIYLAWRFSQKQRVNNKEQVLFDEDAGRPGIDSPLYALLEKLEQETDKRKRGETLISWIKRVFPGQRCLPYLDAVALHYRYRFSPGGDKKQEKDRLSAAISRLETI